MVSTVALNSGRGCPAWGTVRGVREKPLKVVEGLLRGVLPCGGGLVGGEASCMLFALNRPFVTGVVLPEELLLR